MPCCASAKAISVHSPPCRLFKFSMAFAERRGGWGGVLLSVTVVECNLSCKPRLLVNPSSVIKV